MKSFTLFHRRAEPSAEVLAVDFRAMFVGPRAVVATLLWMGSAWWLIAILGDLSDTGDADWELALYWVWLFTIAVVFMLGPYILYRLIGPAVRGGERAAQSAGRVAWPSWATLLAFGPALAYWLSIALPTLAISAVVIDKSSVGWHAQRLPGVARSYQAIHAGVCVAWLVMFGWFVRSLARLRPTVDSCVFRTRENPLIANSRAAMRLRRAWPWTILFLGLPLACEVYLVLAKHGVLAINSVTSKSALLDLARIMLFVHLLVLPIGFYTFLKPRFSGRAIDELRVTRLDRWSIVRGLLCARMVLCGVLLAWHLGLLIAILHFRAYNGDFQWWSPFRGDAPGSVAAFTITAAAAASVILAQVEGGRLLKRLGRG